MFTKIGEFLIQTLLKCFRLIQNFYNKELDKERNTFKKIYKFYLLESKKYASEALNVYCLLDCVEEYIYEDGRQYSIPVTNVDIETGYIDTPENIRDIIILFEQTYPKLFVQFEQLKCHKDTLKRINEGAVNQMGIIPDDIKKSIELYYKYFTNTKDELDSAFKIQAKKLKITQQ